MARRRRHLVALAAVTLWLSVPAAGRAAAPGAPDPGFGPGGVVGLSQGAQLFGVAVQPNGEAVAAGQSGGRLLVERFSASGGPDGVFVGPAGFARAVAIQSDGKIVVAGSSGGALIVQRLTSGLTPDTSFGSSGTATALPGASASADGVAVGRDGSIVAAGSAGGLVGVARFNSSGGLQWSQTLNFGNNSVAHGVAVQPGDGKIVLVGSQRPLQVTNGVVARLNTNGSLDGSFGSGGALTYHYPGGGYTALSSVALQGNGQIVAGGVALAATSDALVLRFNADGGLDGGFGAGGAATLPSGMNVNVLGSPIGAYGVGIAGGGRIVAAGNFQNAGTEFDPALWTFSSAGAPEVGFGSGGTSRGPMVGGEACALAVGPDGSLVAVGNTVTTVSDNDPCRGGGAGFVARYVGFGPPPAAGPAPPGSPTIRPPKATTGAATPTEVSATISGAVTPGGLPTSYHVDYGKTKAYGLTSATASLPADPSAVNVAAVIRKLHLSTTYHYRVVAANSAGLSDGVDATFKTEPSLQAGFHHVVGSYRISTAIKRGLSLQVGCNQPCLIKGSLMISGANARRLGLGRRQLSIGGGSASLGLGATASLVLRLTKASQLTLAHRRSLSLTLQVLTSPVGGGRSIRLARAVTLHA